MSPDPQNIAQLLLTRVERHPDRRFGMIDGTSTLAEAWSAATGTAELLASLGAIPGSRVAVIGTNSDAYLVAWMALHVAGAEAALLNPTYPAELLAEMLDGLEPMMVLWVGRAVDVSVAPGSVHVDLSDVTEHRVGVASQDGSVEWMTTGVTDRVSGLDRPGSEIAGFMHTSGTTGTPKFCAQSHEYFIRLARFVADTMAISERDTVFAPLPLFHINPLGYGVVGGLLANATVLSAPRFSASRFWDDVRENDVSVLILHAPPVEILKRATTSEQAKGHRVRITFFADVQFLDDFDIPLGISAYGSTEAGGLSHTWMWRRGDAPALAEELSRYGGRSRHEIEWRLSDDGEIELRSQRPNVLFSGYQRGAQRISPLDGDGWFATGDLGRVDEAGNLVFIERRAESIRVKGEFVPIGFVEDHFARVLGVFDVAVWRGSSELIDHEVVLYVAADTLDIDALRTASHELPSFMRPRIVLRVKNIPRDAGVGKVRRRQLDEVHVLEQVEL